MERGSLLEEAGILAVAEPTRSKRRSSSGNLRSAAGEVDHSGILGSHLGGRFLLVPGSEPREIGSRAGETADQVRAFDNPKLVRIFGANAKSGLVRLDTARQRLPQLPPRFGA